MKPIEWDYDHCKVVIGSRTVNEAAFQVCNFMNMLLRCIHYSDNKDHFSGDSYSSAIHNLKYEIRELAKYEYSGNYNSSAFCLLDSIKFLFIEMCLHEAEDDIVKLKKAKCHALWFKMCELLMDEFVLLKMFAKLRSREQISKMFNLNYC